MKSIFISCAVSLCAVVFLAACGGRKSVGTPASADTSAVRLADILSSPDRYDGETVVMEGTLTGLCASLCDFTYTEGGTAVTVYMGDEKAPRIPVGQPVRVTASVHKGERQVVFTAVGLEVLPKGGAP